MLLLVSGTWYSMVMTSSQSPSLYTRKAFWSEMIDDNQWHYACKNLDAQLNVFIGAGSHIIEGIKFHPGDSALSSGHTDEFWVSIVLL